MSQKPPSAPRCAALVGPYLSGKTTLLESILSAAGAIGRQGTVKEGNTVGDAAAEARARHMSTEVNVATTDYLGDTWTFLDCPGSIELIQETYNALMVADVAVVVCETGADKAMTLGPLLRFLGDRGIPHMIFLNKMDAADIGVDETVEALQAVSSRPLVVRQVAITEDGQTVGLVDLADERAFRWNPGQEDSPIDMPDSVRDAEAAARTRTLEALADFDDALLERLLEDDVPPVETVFGNLTHSMAAGEIVPVFIGAAEHGYGVKRLLKALRHEAPEPTVTTERLGVKGDGTLAQVFKTLHAAHAGKLSLARVWLGEVTDGMTFDGARVAGISRLLGAKQDKLPKAGPGEVVALGRMESVLTGAVLASGGAAIDVAWPEPLTPLFSTAIHAAQRSDEVKLSGALGRIVEEDPSLSYQQNPDTGELLLLGQGEMHLLIALDRLRNRFHLEVASQRPQVPYKESIRNPVSQHARHKKQSGGHGEFGDVHLDIKPLPRGTGFEFSQTITGGAVPRQYIPAVEAGVKDFMGRGPLGFPVVDIAVTLTDGQFHTVDSSEMAFKKAAQAAMREGMPKCNPVLLEPIYTVRIAIPNEFTPKVQRLVSGRRGQILGFDAKPGWDGWDEVSAQLPQSEMHDLIIDLRSATLGVGTFEGSFDHLQELSGKPADDVVAHRQEALKAS